jgi:hypothetical protein
MRRSVKDDLVPGYDHGLHFVVDTNTSPMRKLIPKEVHVEDASLLELQQASPLVLADYIQKRKQSGECTVVFLSLDTKAAECKLAEMNGPPPRTTPAHTLRDLFPPILLEGADSVVYVVNHTDMVLAIQHKWLPADVYLLETTNTEEKKR